MFDSSFVTDKIGQPIYTCIGQKHPDYLEGNFWESIGRSNGVQKLTTLFSNDFPIYAVFENYW